MSDIKFNTALDKAIKEDEVRRKISFQELNKLEQVIISKQLNVKADITIERITKLLNTDIIMLAKINEEMQIHNPHPALKFNKLSEIFKCSLEIIQNNFTTATEGNLLSVFPINPNSITILGGTKDDVGKIINYSGTSQPNCIQNVYLLLLRAITKEESLANLDLGDIYNPNHSPNIQTTKLPSTFDSSKYISWFYIYSSSKMNQFELLVPTLGYAFGGSRADPHYANKEFKTEDCSSALAKWLGAKAPFITSNMKAVFENSPGCNEDAFCQAAKEVLSPLSTDTLQNHPQKGEIFFFPGHTGIVSNVYYNEQLIETLSYSRDMPSIEGLGYKNYSFEEKAFLYFEERDPLHTHTIPSHTEL